MNRCAKLADLIRQYVDHQPVEMCAFAESLAEHDAAEVTAKDRIKQMRKQITDLTIIAHTSKEMMRIIKVLGAHTQLPGYEHTLARIDKVLAEVQTNPL